MLAERLRSDGQMTRSHRAGWEFSINGYEFGSAFAPDSLRIEFIHLCSKELAEALELALLVEYRWRFKDQPPLNGSGSKYRKVHWWREQQGPFNRADAAAASK